jgi:tetratricopeptide (TPR) repeat protein
MNRKLKLIFGALVVGVVSLSQVVSAQTVQEAMADLNAGRIKKAESSFNKIAESAPTPENLYYLGYFQLKTNDLDKAEQTFTKGAGLDAKNYLNSVGLGTVALAKGNKAKAQEIFAEAEKKTKGKDANVLHRIGEAYTLFEKNTDPAEAIRVLDAATKRDNKLADAFIAKGDAYLIKNEGGPAATAYEFALNAQPGYPLANNRLGELYLRSKNYNLALDFYKKAIDADPNFANAYRDLAELYWLGNQYKRAAENFDLFLQKSESTDPELVLRAAQFAFVSDDYAKSLNLLKSIEGKLDNPIIHRMYGWSYFKTNEMEKSIDELKKFIAVYPEDKLLADDFKYLGRAYNKMSESGEYDSVGMGYLEKAASIDTNAAEAAATYKEIGTIYRAQKMNDKAIAALTKGIQLDTTKATPNDYFTLGLTYFTGAPSLTEGESLGLDSTQLAEARSKYFFSSDSVFNVLSQKLPDWPISYYWRGSSLYNAYSRDENIEKGISLPYFEKFVELGAGKDDTPKGYLRTAYNYLAVYYQNTAGDKEKARQNWEKLLELDPNNATAKEALGLNNQADSSPGSGK